MKGLITSGYVLLSPGYMVNKGCLYPGSEFLKGLGIEVVEDSAEVSPAEIGPSDQLSFINGYIQCAALSGEIRIMLYLKHFGPAPSLDHLSKATNLHRTWATVLVDNLSKIDLVQRVLIPNKGGNPTEIRLTPRGEGWRIGG